MIEEVTRRLVHLVRGALLPSSLSEMELRQGYGGWDTKTPLSGAWLTQVIHTVRCVCVCVSRDVEIICLLYCIKE